jgi:hypothetical protein
MLVSTGELQYPPLPRLVRACGVGHPALVTLDHIALLDEHSGSRPAAAVFGYSTEGAEG